MRNFIKRLNAQWAHVIRHIYKHKKHYALGTFGSFAIAKMLVLFFGLLSGLALFQPTTHAMYENFCSDNSGSLDVPVAECEALIRLYNDTNGDNRTDHANWGISSTICGSWTGVICGGGHITQLNLGYNNLSGIADFGGLTGLTRLMLQWNNITGINLSGLTQLSFLDLLNNDLVRIDVAGLSELSYLWIGNNGITGSIDLSALTKLNNVGLRGNYFTGINVSGLTGLEHLVARGNGLTSIDVSGLTALSELGLARNALTGIDLSGLSALSDLNLQANALTGIDLSNVTGLNKLDIRNNNLTGLDLSGMTSLRTLYANNNYLTSLNLSGLHIIQLHLGDNNISSIDVSMLTGLTELHLGSNPISSLDLSRSTGLTWLHLGNTHLTGIDDILAGQEHLSTLSLDYLDLTSIDLSRFTGLTYLNLNSNQLSSIDLSRFTGLIYLNLNSNQLSSIDLSGLTKISTLSLDNNHLTTLPANLVDLTLLPNAGGLSISNNNINYYTFSPSLLSFIDAKSSAGWRTTQLLCGNGTVEGAETCDDGNQNNRDGCSASCRTQIIAGPFVSCAATDIPQGECESLVHFYTTTNGSGWTTSEGRMQSNMICSIWTGVTCTNDRVTSISLPRNNLSGSADLTGLTGLISLDLGTNDLSEIDLSGLTGLISLSLRANQISGSLDMVCPLPQLTNLMVDNNHFIGDIPLCLQQLTGIVQGYMNHNYLNTDVTDTGLLTFLNDRFTGNADPSTAPWTVQYQLADLLVTGTMYTISGDTFTLHIGYVNRGPKIALSGMLYYDMIEDMQITADKAYITGNVDGIYMVPGDPCYDGLYTNSTGAYRDAFDAWSLAATGGLDFLSFLRANINYQGPAADAGSYFLDVLSSMVGPTNIAAFINQAMGFQISSIPNCGTGGRDAYIFDLGDLASGSGGMIIVTGSFAEAIGIGGFMNTIEILSSHLLWADINIGNNTISVGADHVISSAISGAYLFTGNILFVGTDIATGITFDTTGEIVLLGSDDRDSLTFPLSAFAIITSGWDGVINPPTALLSGATGYASFGETGIVAQIEGNTTRTILSTIQAGSDSVSLIASGGYFTLSFVVSGGAVGDEIKLFRSTDGNSWEENTPDTGCRLDADLICSFQTNHLSYFATVKETTTITPNTPSGGGGGGVTPLKDTEKGLCEVMDYSDSYYDGLCGKYPTTTGIVHEVPKLLINNTGAFNAEVLRIKKLIGRKYSEEFIQGYVFAKDIGITTMTDINKADMKGNLIRSHMAKMIVNFAIKVLNKTPNTGMNCTFTDMQNESSDMQGYARLACQLGLMGLEPDGTTVSKTFNPQGIIDRGQFGTVLSRLLRGGENNGGIVYYTKHLQALKKAGIMEHISTPSNKELRGRVMVMLMRSFLIENK